MLPIMSMTTIEFNYMCSGMTDPHCDTETTDNVIYMYMQACD